MWPRASAAGRVRIVVLISHCPSSPSETSGSRQNS
jgi:hypothetical protein